ncbi:MAG: HDIG domain-containing protein [Planctomycetaceae bacterium]|nr:MAG: HDIG domain-containing protein [Planctomycetaceae bacterium]
MPVDREAAWTLVCEYVQQPGLRRHLLAVEAALRAYARKFHADENLWGCVGLLHDFDYERWPNPPDHPLQGAKILRGLGYPEELIYAILSHADYLQDQFPRRALLDHTLYACDELCGFLTACALVRPERLRGLQAASVKKKLKQPSFAASVNRTDISRGAEELHISLDEHIDFCLDALRSAEQLLDLVPPSVVPPPRTPDTPPA